MAKIKIDCSFCDDEIIIELPITESIECKCCGVEVVRFIED